jgi:hypothetical protein
MFVVNYQEVSGVSQTVFANGSLSAITGMIPMAKPVDGPEMITRALILNLKLPIILLWV